MNEKWPTIPTYLIDFVVDEARRQDDLVHGVGAQLGTKTGLYMVFAAFVFSAEATLAQVGSAIGWERHPSLLAGSLFFSLVAILFLVWAALMRKYRMPPLALRFREQCEEFDQKFAAQGLVDDAKLRVIKERFANSLGRSVLQNFGVNEAISRRLTWASSCLAASVTCLLVSFLLSFLPMAVAWFSRSVGECP